MEARLALIPEAKDTPYGTVKPVEVGKNGNIAYGLSVGSWVVSSVDKNIHITLSADIDTIVHEVATRKGIRAELRQAEKDAKGVEPEKVIEYDPISKRFRQVYL